MLFKTGIMSRSLQEIWQQFLLDVQDSCSPLEVRKWINPIKCQGESNDKKLVLHVPNVFVKEHLLSNYSQKLSLLFGTKKSQLPLTFCIDSTAPKKQVHYVKDNTNLAPLKQRTRPQNLNASYTFDSFVAGTSNQFIKSAAEGVATQPGHAGNVLFLHGSVGLGKTHLLHAMGNHIFEHHPNTQIACLTTEEFINHLVECLQNRSIQNMKKFYRNLDVLLVDDIQFLQNRKNFEDEFCNTFESLITHNKLIVITSDLPPKQLSLSSRIIDRMQKGLTIEVLPPDLETRVAILQDKASRRGVSLSTSLSLFIAERIFGNVRQLEGALNRLIALRDHGGISLKDISQEWIEQELGSLFTKTMQKVSVENILSHVSETFKVQISDLKGTSRAQHITFPRQVAMYLAKELLQDSLLKIASSFGGKTHSTLLHAWKKIKEKMSSDKEIQQKIESAKTYLKNPR